MKISNLGRKSLVQRQDSHTQEDGVNIKVIRMEAAGESDSLVASSGNMSPTNIIVDPQASEIVTIPDRAGMHHSLEAPSSNILPANIIVEPKSFEVVTMPGRAGMSAYDMWLDEGNEGTKEEFFSGLASNKVDKVAGKGLSTNDFTNNLKEKLEGIDLKGYAHDIMIGTVSVYTEEGPFAGFRNIDGHTLQESDTILVVGNGSNNGIYIVNKGGIWQRIRKVEKFQVVSIDNGIVYGGSMQKKMEDGITLQVKNPERSAWRVLI